MTSSFWVQRLHCTGTLVTLRVSLRTKMFPRVSLQSAVLAPVSTVFPCMWLKFCLSIFAIECVFASHNSEIDIVFLQTTEGGSSKDMCQPYTLAVKEIRALSIKHCCKGKILKRLHQILKAKTWLVCPFFIIHFYEDHLREAHMCIGLHLPVLVMFWKSINRTTCYESQPVGVAELLFASEGRIWGSRGW